MPHTRVPFGLDASTCGTKGANRWRNNHRAPTRKAALPAVTCANAANEVLHAHTPDQFVTGLLMRIRLSDGAVEVVDAGHPFPFLMREDAVTAATGEMPTRSGI